MIYSRPDMEGGKREKPTEKEKKGGKTKKPTEKEGGFRDNPGAALVVGALAKGEYFPFTTFHRLSGPITLTVYSYTLRETDTFLLIVPALFAGMVSLINDERLKRNKTTVGFLNPALYALHKSDGPKVFRDVKEGSSKCPNPKMTGAMVGCCKHGFRTGKGWDPLTGLGSVDFARLRDELAGLP